MRISELKPNTVYARKHDAWNIPEFLITTERVCIEEDVPDSWPRKTRKVVEFFPVLVVNGALNGFGGVRTSTQCSEIGWEVGSIDDFKLLLEERAKKAAEAQEVSAERTAAGDRLDTALHTAGIKFARVRDTHSGFYVNLGATIGDADRLTSIVQFALDHGWEG